MRFFLAFLITTLVSCQNNQQQVQPTQVEHNTLLIASGGSVFSYNLDENKVNWTYTSKQDTPENRNYFALNGQHLLMPFESGKLVNLDVKTGEIRWQQQIYGIEDDIIFSTTEESLEKNPMSPLFMSQPLIDNDNVVIASTSSDERAWLYNFDLNQGEKKWSEELVTKYNFFAPVKCRDYYFVNSAVFLKKYDIKMGVSTSYGMFDGAYEYPDAEPNQFENPIYVPIQSDGENLYIGDEKGNYYCLPLNKNGNVKTQYSISEPNNTFIKNPAVFKWIYSDKDFPYSQWYSFLDNNTLYVVVKDGNDKQSALVAIDTKNGKPKWKQGIDTNELINVTLQAEKLTGINKKQIFWIDTNGKNFTQVQVANQPISNLEWLDSTHLIYISVKGIEVLDTQTKTSKIIFEKNFENVGYHNYTQIKFLKK